MFKKDANLFTILRFPLLFGGFLSMMALAFNYRDSWLGDIEAERDKLYKQNVDNNKMVEDFKKKHGK